MKTTTIKPHNRALLPVRLLITGIAMLLSFPLAFGQAIQPSAKSDEDKKNDNKKENVIKLEKIEVTGSRIKRIDVETSVPVEIYKATDIEARGYVNIGDFIQSLSFNTSTGNNIYQNNTFTKGASTINIRGLGSERVLTLVNGRRMASYSLLQFSGRAVFDLNSLPSAAIDSVEFLKDGASAIYGADAITGVLNVKLKKNFEGLYVSTYYANTFKNNGNDSGTWQINAVAGASSSKTSIMTAVSYKHANSSYIRDYGITSYDLSYMGKVRGAMYSSSYTIPANVRLTQAQVAASNAATGASLVAPNGASVTANTRWYYAIPNSVPTANPTINNFTLSNPTTVTVPTPSGASTVTIPQGSLALSNRSFSNADSQLYPSYDYSSAFSQIEHTFTENIKGFIQLMYTQNSTYYNSGLNPISLLNEGLTLPASNPYNPFGIKLDDALILGNFLPARKVDVDSTTVNVLTGLRGTVFGDWSWETAVSYGYNSIILKRRNLISPSIFQAALNATDPKKAFNPFGPSDPDLVKSFATTSTGNNKTQVLTYDANATGSLLELPWGGSLGLAAGFEARAEKLNLNPDPNRYIGYGGSGPMQGDRNVTSLYAEANLPWRTLEVAAAIRMEHYSDFGTSTKPKISAKYAFPKNKIVNVVLRGSWSESFQAPALGIYYGTQTIGYTSVIDPKLPEGSPAVQVKIVSGGNPTLLPEEGKTYYLGAVFEIPKVKDLSFSVDFFNMRINNNIVTPSASYVLSDKGSQQFPNAVIRNPDGTLNQINVFPQNNPDSYQYYKGFDLGLRYTINDTRYGSFGFSGGATYIWNTGWDSGFGGGYINNTGLYFNPRWRYNLGASWGLKRWGASVSTDTIGAYWNDGYPHADAPDGWQENPYTLVNLNVSYRGPWNTIITAGFSNLFNNRPPENARASVYGFDQNAYGAGAQGRLFYTRIGKQF